MHCDASSAAPAAVVGIGLILATACIEAAASGQCACHYPDASSAPARRAIDARLAGCLDAAGDGHARGVELDCSSA